MRLSIAMCVILVAVCSPAGLGAFDFTITDTYDHGTVELNSESLLVTGSGAHLIDAMGSSYIEVQGTLPLELHVGGIYALTLRDDSVMSFYGGELGAGRLRNNGRAVFVCLFFICL